MKKILLVTMVLASFSSFAGLCEFGKTFGMKQSFSIDSKEECICIASDTILPVDSSTFKVKVKYMEFPELGGKADIVYKEKMKFNELVKKARELDAQEKCEITEWKE